MPEPFDIDKFLENKTRIVIYRNGKPEEITVAELDHMLDELKKPRKDPKCQTMQ